jgi:GT2 family glycosyltransferase
MTNSSGFAGVTASVVLYGHTAEQVRPLFQSLARETVLQAWAVVDNGGSAEACALATQLGGRVVASPGNIGYGRANNLAIQDLAGQGRYHLIVNPDIRFEGGVLAALCTFMDRHPEIGQVMPQILYEDGTEQRLCKLLPTPFDLIVRRFLGGLGRMAFRAQWDAYEMRGVDLSIPRQVPSLSGCFMFVRKAALDEVGLFDERFSMYMEDFDLCRRIGSRYQTAFEPRVHVFHGYAKGSYGSSRLLLHHLRSAVRYFNKWGWFLDPERSRLNSRMGAIEEPEVHQRCVPAHLP